MLLNLVPSVSISQVCWEDSWRWWQSVPDTVLGMYMGSIDLSLKSIGEEKGGGGEKKELQSLNCLNYKVGNTRELS